MQVLTWRFSRNRTGLRVNTSFPSWKRAMHRKISTAKCQNQEYQKYSNVETTVRPKDRWFGDLRVMQDVEVVIVSMYCLIPNVPAFCSVAGTLWKLSVSLQSCSVIKALLQASTTHQHSVRDVVFLSFNGTPFSSA